MQITTRRSKEPFLRSQGYRHWWTFPRSDNEGYSRLNGYKVGTALESLVRFVQYVSYVTLKTATATCRWWQGLGKNHNYLSVSSDRSSHGPIRAGKHAPAFYLRRLIRILAKSSPVLIAFPRKSDQHKRYLDLTCPNTEVATGQVAKFVLFRRPCMEARCSRWSQSLHFRSCSKGLALAFGIDH